MSSPELCGTHFPLSLLCLACFTSYKPKSFLTDMPPGYVSPLLCTHLRCLTLNAFSSAELSEAFKSQRNTLDNEMQLCFFSVFESKSKAESWKRRFQLSENFRISLTRSRLDEHDWIITFDCSSHHFLFVPPSWTVTANSCRALQLTGSLGVGRSDSPLSVSFLGASWPRPLLDTRLNTVSWTRSEQLFVSLALVPITLRPMRDTENTSCPKCFLSPDLIKYQSKPHTRDRFPTYNTMKNLSGSVSQGHTSGLKS